jgi:hypothetical protein
MRRHISAFAVLLAIVGLGAVPAACGPQAPTADGIAAERPGLGTDESVAMRPDDERASVPERLVGRVLALDVEQGRLLLGTDAGTIALRGTPEQLADLEVGDTIEVALEESSVPEPRRI